MTAHVPPTAVVADTPDSFEDSRFFIQKMIELFSTEKELLRIQSEGFQGFREDLIQSLKSLQEDYHDRAKLRTVWMRLNFMRNRLARDAGEDSEATRAVGIALKVYQAVFGFHGCD